MNEDEKGKNNDSDSDNGSTHTQHDFLLYYEDSSRRRKWFTICEKQQQLHQPLISKKNRKNFKGWHFQLMLNHSKNRLILSIERPAVAALPNKFNSNFPIFHSTLDFLSRRFFSEKTKTLSLTSFAVYDTIRYGLDY